MTDNKVSSYIGRFAPSPTGSLHFGSLIAAVASYLCAKKNNGKWLLRIENIDSQREQHGSATSIIQSLEDYGFKWNDSIRYQSQHLNDYQDALNSLEDYTFPCRCTRKDLQTNASGGYSYIYPGTCRKGLSKSKNSKHSIRLRSDIIKCSDRVTFVEYCQNVPLLQNIEKQVGDFILKRSDDLFAYQLAVVVDDHIQKITDVVRGADLFDNTPRQRYLQCLLGYKQPNYLHIPVAITANGKKLSKQNTSSEISTSFKRITLLDALSFLGQEPPHHSNFSMIDDIWLWAVQNWQTDRIPKTLTKACPKNYE